MNQKTKKSAGATLALLVLLSVALVSLPVQRVMAAGTEITAISPNSGFVGTQVTVTGTINTTDGFFTVKWNQTLNITTGQATGFNASASFVVPPTVGAITGRNITVELIDNTTSSVAAANFTLYAKFDMQVTTPPAPKQLQEGNTTSILVNVTGGASNTIYTANITVKDPANQTHWATASISNTTSIGSGESIKTYPFVGVGMNYTGTYNVTSYLVTSNLTAVKEFFVGLTDKTEYQRNETVHVQAAGYKPLEAVIVNIKKGNTSVTGFPSNLTVNSVGVLSSSWTIPFNATPGIYSVSVINATSGGTVKTPGDIQDFEVLGALCSVRAVNLAGEGVANAAVEVYNATSPSVLLMKGNTSSTGLIRFNLGDGDYTFKGFFKNVEVGSVNKSVAQNDTAFDLPLSLVNVVAIVETQGGFSFPKVRVPFVDIGLEYNYTTRDNKNYTETIFMQTNVSGVAEVRNLFTKTDYGVEAKLYGALFNSTTLTVETLPISPVTLPLFLPTYTLNVHALDSKGLDASEVQVIAYEWTYGATSPFESSNTNSSGDVSFLLPFGRYILRAFVGDVFLNETVVNLLENPFAFTFNLVAANVDVAVSVSDYFGQPIANANVTIERKASEGYVFAYSQVTGGDGSAAFASKLGGDSRISVYVAGRLAAVKTQFLGAGSNQVKIQAGEYVAILGYPINTGLFTLFSFTIVLIVAVLVLVRKRLMKAVGKRLKR